MKGNGRFQRHSNIWQPASSEWKNVVCVIATTSAWHVFVTARNRDQGIIKLSSHDLSLSGEKFRKLRIRTRRSSRFCQGADSMLSAIISFDGKPWLTCCMQTYASNAMIFERENSENEHYVELRDGNRIAIVVSFLLPRCFFSVLFSRSSLCSRGLLLASFH